MKIAHDMHSNIKVLTAIVPQAVGTTGIAGGKLSAAIDRKGYDSITFVYQSGASAAATDTINPIVYEADATDGTFTSAASGSLIGTEAPLTPTSVGAIKRVGYRGTKRYAKLRLYGLGTATAIVGAAAVLGTPESAPVA